MRFLVKLSFRVLPDLNGSAEFDEQWRLVKAGSIYEAISRAFERGIDECGTGQDAGTTPVSWEFIGITEVIDLDQCADGQLLYSDTKHEDAHSYINYIRTKALTFVTQQEAVTQ
jgi:hypothetical protein